MATQSFPRYFQDESAQLQVKLISAKMQYVVLAHKSDIWFNYQAAQEPVQAHTIPYLEKHLHPSSEALFLEKLTEVLDYFAKVRKHLAEKLANQTATI